LECGGLFRRFSFLLLFLAGVASTPKVRGEFILGEKERKTKAAE
jgi:hypothetical protein